MFLAISLPLLSIFGFSWTVRRRTKISLSYAPLVVISSIVLVLFLADFLFLMRPISLALAVCGLALFFLEVVSYLKQNGLAIGSRALLRLLGFGFFIILLAEYNTGAMYVSWDEFSHWGSIIKLTKFAGTALHLIPQGFSLYFQDYPPGTAYASYFFLNFIGYSEEVVLFVHAFIILCASLPIIGAAARVSFTRGVLAAIFVFIFVILIGQGWSTTLIDQIVGALFGAALAICWLERSRPAMWISIAPVLGFLALAKDSGFFFAIAVLILVFLCVISSVVFGRRKPESPSNMANRKVMVALLLCISVPLCVSQLWSFHVESNNLSRSLAGTSLLNMLGKMQKCCVTPREKSITTHFVERMGGYSDNQHEDTLTRSTFEEATHFIIHAGKADWSVPGKLILVFLFLGLIIAAIHQRAFDRWLFGALVLGANLGAVMYSLVLLLYYLYGFSEYEGRVLASMERFFMSYAFGVAYLLFAGLFSIQSLSKWRNIVSFAMLVVSLSAFSYGGQAKVRNYLQYGGMKYFPARDEIKPLVHPFVDMAYPRTSVLAIWQSQGTHQVGLEYWILRYELQPRNVQNGCFSFGPPQYSGDTTTCNWSEDVFRKGLVNYHYVFVGNGLQSLRHTYPAVFSEADGSANTGIFQVVQGADGAISLIPKTFPSINPQILTKN